MKPRSVPLPSRELLPGTLPLSLSQALPNWPFLNQGAAHAPADRIVQTVRVALDLAHLPGMPA
jgi:hypothetical protein